ncbi:MAG: ATP-binding protein [Salinispira sp.]
MIKFSLYPKLLLGVIFVFTVMSVIVILLSVQSQRNEFLYFMSTSVEQHNDIFESVFRRLMAEGREELALSVLLDLQDLYGDDNFRLFQTDGTAAFSNYRTIGNLSETQDTSSSKAVQRPHFNDSLVFRKTVENWLPQTEINVKLQQSEYFFPISSTANCRDCDENSIAFRGVVYYQKSFARLYALIDRTTTFITIVLLVSGGIFVIIIIIFVRYSVLRPLRAMEQTLVSVAQGAEDISVNLKIYDEFGVLADKLNNMLHIFRERLENSLRQNTADITEKENKKYLRVVNDGILFINSDRKITSNVSASLERLFGMSEFAGKSLSDFLYPDEPENGTFHTEIDEFLDIAFEIDTEKSLLHSQNPLTGRKIFIKERNKNIIVDCVFHRIIEDGQVAQVMVIFNDRTVAADIRREFEHERKKNEDERALIAKVLTCDRTLLSKFLTSCREIVHALSHSHSHSQMNVETAVEEIRSLIARSGKLKLEQAEKILRNIEHELSINPQSGSLEVFCAELEVIVKNVEKTMERFMPMSSVGSANNLIEFRKAAEDLVHDLSKKFDKKIDFSIRGNIHNLHVLPDIRSSLLQIIRNAVEHGIESGKERKDSGKNENGKVEIIFSKQPDGYKIIIADDGRGINFPLIEQHARELGAVTGEVTHDDLLKLLFLPQLSTTNEKDRGAGLKMVQNVMHTLGGKLSFYTKSGNGTHLTIYIPAHS